ncbi:cell wall-binding repeat-containing protein [Agrococcus sediminis]|uniref:cell wall-binding repeat-containing protein n=1 Tax=Agrococcus sediminis TaxID=2599924 RepID=UPI00341540DF
MNNHFKRNLAAGAACAVGLGLLVAPSAALATDGGGDTPADAHGTVVNLIHFNDFHGRIDSNTVSFAGTVEQLRAEQGDANSLVISGGDSIGASLYASAVQQDAPTIDVLNALELEASAAGNHEFDRGIDDLQGRVDERADFPILAANATRDGAPIGDSYATFSVGEGDDAVTVAVIGAVTEETPSLVDPSGIAGVEFGDPVAAVNAVAAQLSDGDATNGEADLIVAEYHEGAQATLAPNAPQEEQAAALTAAMADSDAFRAIVEDTAPEVDAIFNGHTHQSYSWLAPAPDGSEQDVRPIIQTSSYGAQLGQLVATVDPATSVASFDLARIVPRTQTPQDELIATYPRVAAVAEITEAALEQAAVIGQEPLGEITGDITTAFTGDERDDRGSASTMGTLVANMLRDQLAPENRGGAEIGITNPGGLRAELLYEAGEGETEDGIVTVGEAAAVLPFANNLWTTTLTGEQLRVVLEQQWQRNAAGEVPSRAYLQLGLSDNVEYTYDSTLAEGSRITGIWVDGSEVAADDTYRVAVPSFLLSGGDNFRGLIAGTDDRDSGLVDSEAFAAYIEAQSPISPDFSRRQLEVVGLPTAPVAIGAPVSLTVNEIDLTSLGTPVSTELELHYGDELLGTFPVVDDSATVEFEAPLPVAGDRFELRTASGTAVPFSMPIALTTERLDGVNRYETAVQVSQDAYPGGAPVVYVASGQLFPDALTAGPAAAHEGGPVLLTRLTEAPEVVLDEIERLGAARVVIVGGEPSISAETEAQIAAIASVEQVDRLGGSDRYHTSRLVAEYAFEGAEGAYVAAGTRFPDGLSAGAAAGHLDWPLLLVSTSTEVPEATTALLDELGADRIRIAGSAEAVPSSIAGDFVDAGFTVNRLGGSDRYATSAIITASAFDAPVERAYLASGLVFPDALAGGAAAGAQDAPLLITRTDCVPQRILDELERLQMPTLTLVGGEPSLSAEVAALTSCS